MRNKTIKYIAFYDIMANKDENRQIGLAAINKINYVCDSLVKNNYKVEIISPSWTNNLSGFYKGKKIIISDDIMLKTFATFGAQNRLARIIKYIFSLLQLFCYLMKNTKKGESIIVYHSVMLIIPLILLKKLKKLKLILEVEEIYSDISGNKKQRAIEDKIFKEADAYIFPTELLNDKLNSRCKPSIIAYGNYKVEDFRNENFDDDKIHIVYAGTLDPRKGGLVAVGAAEYLDDNYHIHIIGFGNDEQKLLLKNKIEDISLKSKCIVTYDGLYTGEEYISFLQKCNIGLSPQILNAEYNDTSFPSKVLSYMSNGLRVVSIKIKSLEKSEINELLYYYDKDSSKEVARAIRNVNLSDKYNSREKIKLLDKKFIKNINKLMEIVNE